MKGTMLTYSNEGGLTVRPIEKPPEVETLRHAVGDDFELVPHFVTIDHGDKTFACVAYCGKHGKMQVPPLPINYRATLQWERSLRRQGMSLFNPDMDDHLVGPIVVIFGDDELMRAL